MNDFDRSGLAWDRDGYWTVVSRKAPKFRALLEQVAWHRFDAPMFVRSWCAGRLESTGGHHVQVRRLELFEFIRSRRGVRFAEIAAELSDLYPAACGLSNGRTNGPGRMLFRDLRALLDRRLIERAERGLFVAAKVEVPGVASTAST